MASFKSIVLLIIALAVNYSQCADLRGENCDPIWKGDCKKGDLIDELIADCCSNSIIKCNAVNDGWWYRTVDLDKDDQCKPCGGQQKFACGERGTNSRCVCDDEVTYKTSFLNKCRCQYWPTETFQKAVIALQPPPVRISNSEAKSVYPASEMFMPSEVRNLQPEAVLPSEGSTIHHGFCCSAIYSIIMYVLMHFFSLYIQ